MSNPWKQYKNRVVSSDVKPWDFLDPNTEYAEKEVAKQRYDLCLGCPELIQITRQCKICGCFMAAKTKLKNAACPLGKW